MRFVRIVLVFLCIVPFLGSQQAWGQATSSLRGNVTDSKGAVISGAAVTLTLTTTGAVRVDMTNKSGEYQFSQLLPGRYELDVASPGFATSKSKGIDIQVNLPATINVAMTVATSTTEVTVQSDVQPMLNTTDATLGNVLDQEQVEDLPSANRNTNNLLSLQPGVIYLGAGSSGLTDDTRSGAVNGGRSDQGNITLDGVDVNNINSGGAFLPVLRITQDTVAEFRVVTSNPTSTDGRSSGAQTAIVTKSGSNEIHGTFYEYNRTDLWEANDFFAKQTQAANGTRNIPTKLIYNVFGVAVGAPIVKDKAFVFFNYEGQRYIHGATGNATIPTASFRAGNVSYACFTTSACTMTSPALPGATYYTLTPAQIQGMDPQGIGDSSIVLSLMNSLPLPNNPLAGDGLNTEGYNFIYSGAQNENDTTARFDWKITANGKHSAFWRGTLQDDATPGTTTLPGYPPSSNSRNHNKGFAAGYTYLISDNLVNNLAFGLTRQGTGTTGEVSSPYITFFFTVPQSPYNATSSVIAPVYNLVDNLSWTKHNHNLVFGTDMRFIEDIESSNASSYANAGGNALYLNGSSVAGSNGPFDPSGGGNSYPKVATNSKPLYSEAILAAIGALTGGKVSYNTTKTGAPLAQNAPLVRDYRWNEYEFYAQDTWKATKDLTVIYGLRYSYQQVPAETTGTQVGICQIVGGACAPGGFSLSTYLNTSSNLAAAGLPANNAGELGFPLNGRYNNQPDYWTPDKLDFAPRFAIAYSPTASSGLLYKIFGNGKTSIRAGYSMAYDHFGAGIVNTFNSDGAYGLSTQLQTPTGSFNAGTAPRITSLNSVPSVLLPPAPPVGFPGIPPATGTASEAIDWAEDSAIKTPYTEMVDFSIARQLNKGSSIEVSYVGRFSHRLLEQEDVAMPTNLAAAGTNYFAAAQQLALLVDANTPIGSVPSNPYWETLFAPLIHKNIGYGSGLTATQNVYGLFRSNQYNETQALEDLDLPNSYTGASVNTNNAYPTNRFYHDQFSSLYAWRSIGSSNYNALQAVYHQRFGLGLNADFNYVYSKSLDITSQAEREENSGLPNGAQVLNTWSPNQLYGPSDFDVRHQITANYIWNLPFGRGQHFFSSMGRLTDELVGGWQTTGIVRWTSGLPFEVTNGNQFYPTNWNIEGYGTLHGPPPTAHGSGPGSPLQQRFANPTAAIAAFSHTLVGNSGTRNPLRGDGYFDIDAGLGKTFPVTNRLKLKLGVEMFNVSNSVRFDPKTISADLLSPNPNTFGVASQTLTQSRQTQFYGRFIF